MATTQAPAKRAENGKGFQTARILCESPGCRWQGRTCSTVVCLDEEWDGFVEDYGHGGESRCDYCVACGRLGVLQDPE